VLRRPEDGLIRITVLTLWTSMAAVVEFAGADPDAAVVEPAALKAQAEAAVLRKLMLGQVADVSVTAEEGVSGTPSGLSTVRTTLRALPPKHPRQPRLNLRPGYRASPSTGTNVTRPSALIVRRILLATQ